VDGAAALRGHWREAGASAFASGSGAQLLSAEVWEVQDIQWDDSEEGPGNHA